MPIALGNDLGCVIEKYYKTLKCLATPESSNGNISSSSFDKSPKGLATSAAGFGGFNGRAMPKPPKGLAPSADGVNSRFMPNPTSGAGRLVALLYVQLVLAAVFVALLSVFLCLR